jgi:CRP-like cAMP-binding protein
METGALGKVYEDGQILIRQGEVGDCMYVIQKGQVAVFREKDGHEVGLAVLGEGEILGEMAVFEREVRSATVRALGEVRALTVDKKNFLRRIREDPSLGFRLMQLMSKRVRDLSNEITRLRGS